MSHCQAGPPKIDSQLFGGVPSGLASAQTYQSARGLVRLLAAFREPGMGVGGVAQHQIDDDPEVQALGFGHQAIEIVQRAEQGVDADIVGHVIAEIAHRRRVERRDPHRVGAQRGDVGQAVGNPRQVADAVAIGVAKTTRIDLVQDGTPPPFRVGLPCRTSA